MVSDIKFKNEGADRYCQKFESANEYTQGGTGNWSHGTAISGTDLASAITAAEAGGGYVNTDGGTGAQLPASIVGIQAEVKLKGSLRIWNL